MIWHPRCFKYKQHCKAGIKWDALTGLHRILGLTRNQDWSLYLITFGNHRRLLLGAYTEKETEEVSKRIHARARS